MSVIHPDLVGEELPLQQPTALHHAKVTTSKQLNGAVVATATKLLPLLAMLDTIQQQAASESVFRARRKKIKAHLAVAYAELAMERPRRYALAHAFHTLAELVREETRDISPDELRQAAKEVALATLKNAPALINAAHQARLLS